MCFIDPLGLGSNKSNIQTDAFSPMIMPDTFKSFHWKQSFVYNIRFFSFVNHALRISNGKFDLFSKSPTVLCVLHKTFLSLFKVRNRIVCKTRKIRCFKPLISDQNVRSFFLSAITSTCQSPKDQKCRIFSNKNWIY